MTIDVDMYPYDEIRDHAFRHCLINDIRIPEGVTSIGKSAFKNCKELRKDIFHQHFRPSVLVHLKDVLH